MARWVKLALAAAAVVGTYLLLGTRQALPGCSDSGVQILLRKILVGQLGLPDQIIVENTRTVSGSIFSRSYACGASINGLPDSEAFLGMGPGAVDYQVQKTDDGRLYVSAKLVMTAAPSAAPGLSVAGPQGKE